MQSREEGKYEILEDGSLHSLASRFHPLQDCSGFSLAVAMQALTIK